MQYVYLVLGVAMGLIGAALFAQWAVVDDRRSLAGSIPFMVGSVMFLIIGLKLVMFLL